MFNTAMKSVMEMSHHYESIHFIHLLFHCFAHLLIFLHVEIAECERDFKKALRDLQSLRNDEVLSQNLKGYIDILDTMAGIHDDQVLFKLITVSIS